MAENQNAETQCVRLKTCDGQVMEIEEHISLRMETIKSLMERELCGDIIVLGDINSSILKMVIKWLEYKMHEKETPAVDADGNQVLSDWEMNFLNVEQPILYKLIKAGYFLGIPALMNLVTAVTKRLKNDSQDTPKLEDKKETEKDKKQDKDAEKEKQIKQRENEKDKRNKAFYGRRSRR